MSYAKLDRCTSRYTPGGISYRVIIILSFEMWVNKSVMIIIIRALSHVRKNEKGPKLPTQKNMERGRRAQMKKKKREKRREGTMLLSFSTLVLHDSTMFFMIESFLLCQYASGNLHYITWLVYSNDGLPQNCPRSSWTSKLDAHPLVLLLSFHILIALVHPSYGNPYSFTLIYINGHLHSPLIRRVNVTISSFLSHNLHHTLFHL